MKKDSAALNVPLSNNSSTDKDLAQTHISHAEDIDALRNAVWKKALERLRSEQPQLLAEYEGLVKDQSGVAQSAKLDSETMALMVSKQNEIMENKQWT